MPAGVSTSSEIEIAHIAPEALAADREVPWSIEAQTARERGRRRARLPMLMEDRAGVGSVSSGGRDFPR
jgi:hypothetical protein